MSSTAGTRQGLAVCSRHEAAPSMVTGVSMGRRRTIAGSTPNKCTISRAVTSLQYIGPAAQVSLIPW